MEVAAAGDDLGLVVGDALDRVGPFASRLDRGLDGFRAGVHRQRHVLPGQFAGFREERTEFVRVEGARNDVERTHLFAHQADETRVGMAVTDGRVRAHHVEVLLTGLVPHENAFAVREHDGKRMIVVRAIARLEVNVRVHRWSCLRRRRYSAGRGSGS